MKRKDINIILTKIKNTINNNKSKFIVSNRDKNNLFCSEYSLTSKVIKRIINNLNIYDFAKVLDNYGNYEKLYLFAPYIELINSYGEHKKIQLYLKINYIYEHNTIIIVSLHECEYKLKYYLDRSEY